MARSDNAGGERGPEPTGEKCSHTAPASGGQAARTDPKCALCALLWPPAKHHGLRIALVDGDEGTRRAAREMVRAQRDGWALESYQPSCHLHDPARQAQAPGRSGTKGDHASRPPPDMVLLDPSALGLCSRGCVRSLKARSPGLPVVVISARSDADSIMRNILAGADGYLLKPVPPGELARAVSSAARGLPVLCPGAERVVMDFLHRAGRTAPSQELTPREQQIMYGAAEGLHYADICTRLELETNTLHVHMVNIFRKLGVHSRKEAVRKFLWGGGAKSRLRHPDPSRWFVVGQAHLTN